MGTKNNPGAFDCYANAHPDEPMFILLGRDKHAPALVWLWAALRELDGEDPAKVAEARDCVGAMFAWAKAHDRPAIGTGQAALVAVLELIRAGNAGMKLLRKEPPQNLPTDNDLIRLFLAETQFEEEQPAAPEAKP